MRRHGHDLCALLLAATSAVAALADDGGGRQRPTNRLQHETSPYLLLHAHNPVDWYPWGPEAIDRARQEEKPIFLSVGYSSCYWCHVMEREAFSSPEIAAFLNRHFVNIKVDREERPEIDEIYMTATQLLAGRGGWPNSVFLTPELEPFFAGTYFPEQQFAAILQQIEEAWRDRRPQITDFSKRVAGQLRAVLTADKAPTEELPSRELALQSVHSLKGRHDPLHGGFGGAPKFPSPASLKLLWTAGQLGDPEATEMVLRTLRKMVRGGIYDQVGGGFHRYSTDARWEVPHFEKMLYDNAHLAELLAHAAHAADDPELERACRGSLEFVQREMMTAEGAFKSALDAETEAEEGAYYVWSHDEIKAALGAAGFARLAPLFGLDEEPNFDGGRYVLRLPDSLESLTAPDRAATTGSKPALSQVAAELKKLREARARRPYPLVDDKVLTDWNGMMIAAHATAGRLLDSPAYVAAARRAADFVLTHSRAGDGGLLHSWRAGQAKIAAFLDDYVFLIGGLLALDDATDDDRWLEEAIRLADELERMLAAPGGGYYASIDDPLVLFQIRSVTDGAVPSGNATAIRILGELAKRTGNPGYRQRAEAALRAFSGSLESYPQATHTLARAVLEQAASAAGPAVTVVEPVDGADRSDDS